VSVAEVDGVLALVEGVDEGEDDGFVDGAVGAWPWLDVWVWLGLEEPEAAGCEAADCVGAVEPWPAGWFGDDLSPEFMATTIATIRTAVPTTQTAIASGMRERRFGGGEAGVRAL